MRLTGEDVREKIESKRFTVIRNLKSSSLPSQELTCILSGLKLATKLTKLDLCRTGLSFVPQPDQEFSLFQFLAEVLSKIVIKLEEMEMRSIQLNHHQILSVCKAIVRVLS